MYVFETELLFFNLQNTDRRLARKTRTSSHSFRITLPPLISVSVDIPTTATDLKDLKASSASCALTAMVGTCLKSSSASSFEACRSCSASMIHEFWGGHFLYAGGGGFLFHYAGSALDAPPPPLPPALTTIQPGARRQAKL